MADDWRVTATLHQPGHTEELVDRMQRHRVGDEVLARLGGRVAVSTGASHVFVYADSEGAAHEAVRVVQELSRENALEAGLELHRWHPLEERWEEATVPMPRTDAEREAEHRRLQQAEAKESQELGLAEWEVRVELESHRQTTELADRLAAEGMEPVRRWTYLVVGANNEDEARVLADRLRDEAPAGAGVTVEPGPGMIKEGTARARTVGWFFGPF
ncbi:MAG TPA: hypothetical protein VKC59_01575 [Candidatus Limnocylindrales bacterium]|nr:hypothetical protein [Candidatus Limnocylindrales bacterium]